MFSQWKTPMKAHVRSFATSAAFQKHSSFQQLDSSIRRTLLSIKGKTDDEQSTYVSMIKEILKFDTKNRTDHGSINSVNTLFNDVVESPSFRINDESLKIILSLKPSINHTLKVIDAFYIKNPASHIPKSTAMIPLRELLWDGKIDDAMKLIEVTTGAPPYIAYKKRRQRAGLLKYAGGLGGIIAAIDFGVRSYGAQSQIGVYAMVATYIFNMSALAAISFQGRFTGENSFIRFRKGITPVYRYQHADELGMVAKVAEVDIKINGLDGFASEKLVENIKQKKMELLEPESEIMLQEYWLSGGNNLEWAEPDQDPATIIWNKRTDELRPKGLKANTNWTSNLIESAPEDSSNPDIKSVLA